MRGGGVIRIQQSLRGGRVNSIVTQPQPKSSFRDFQCLLTREVPQAFYKFPVLNQSLIKSIPKEELYSDDSLKDSLFPRTFSSGFFVSYPWNLCQFFIHGIEKSISKFFYQKTVTKYFITYREIISCWLYYLEPTCFRNEYWYRILYRRWQSYERKNDRYKKQTSSTLHDVALEVQKYLKTVKHLLLNSVDSKFISVFFTHPLNFGSLLRELLLIFFVPMT